MFFNTDAVLENCFQIMKEKFIYKIRKKNNACTSEMGITPLFKNGQPSTVGYAVTFTMKQFFMMKNLPIDPFVSFSHTTSNSIFNFTPIT